jgi:outer membrane autotransporter protein
VALLSAVCAIPARAQDATWSANPANSNWQNPANWNPGVPGGTGTAFFGPSLVTGIGFGGAATTNIGTMSFSDPGYQFTLCFCEVVDIGGAGIVSSVANAPLFQVDGTLIFRGFSSAGFARLDDIGAGLFQFFGNSTAADATINLSGGRLEFYGQSSAGRATITNNFGQILFDVNSNAGTAQITNIDGTINFAGQSSAANATIFNQSSSFYAQIIFDNRSTAGNATIFNGASSTVEFRGRSDAGTATINSSAGAVSFTDQASAANSTLNIDGGLLLFDKRSTAASATIALTNSAQAWFAVRATGGLADFITDFGTLVDFSQTRGPDNNGQISAGSFAGGGTVYIGHGNTLTVGGNNKSTEFWGAFEDGCGCGSGAGSLVKVGTGTFILSGTNYYTGTTQVDAGVLAVNGSIERSSLLTINPAGTVAGNGVLPSTLVHGVLSPGNGSIDTITVAGSLAFSPSGVLAIEVNSFSADLVRVTPSSFYIAPGTAALGGTLLATGVGGPYAIGNRYEVLNTIDGVTGRFDRLFVAGSFGSTRPVITYDAPLNPYIVYLDLIQGEVSSQLKGATQNQIEVARALDSALLKGADFGPFTPLYNLTGDTFLKALDQISGEANTGIFQSVYQSVSNFISSMLNPFNNGRSLFGPATPYAPEDDDVDAYAAKRKISRQAQQAMAAAMPVKAAPARDNRYGVWANAYGGQTSIDADAVVGSHQTNVRGYGFAAGLDYRVAPEALIGFAMAGGNSSWGLSEGLGGGRTDNFHAGVYGSLRYGPAYLSAAMAYGHHWVSTKRNVVMPGFATLESDYDANSFGGRIEAGYRYGLGSFGLTPYAALQATVVRLPGYSENATAGNNAFALQYGSQSDNLFRTELGSWFDHSRVIPGGVLTLRARAAWAHDEGANRSMTGAFPFLPGSTFLVQGANPGSNLALLSAGAEWRYWSGWSFAARFDSELSDRSRGYGGTGVVRYVW